MRGHTTLGRLSRLEPGRYAAGIGGPSITRCGSGTPRTGEETFVLRGNSGCSTTSRGTPTGRNWPRRATTAGSGSGMRPAVSSGIPRREPCPTSTERSPREPRAAKTSAGMRVLHPGREVQGSPGPPERRSSSACAVASPNSLRTNKKRCSPICRPKRPERRARQHRRTHRAGSDRPRPREVANALGRRRFAPEAARLRPMRCRQSSISTIAKYSTALTAMPTPWHPRSRAKPSPCSVSCSNVIARYRDRMVL